MIHRARVATRAVPVVALALAVGGAVGGCASAAASAGAQAPASRPAATRSAAPVYGPRAPDPACAAAKQAERTLQSRQIKDQSSESALDKDFTNYAGALTAAAQHAKQPAVVQAMNALANDFNALVQSQSGGAQLPDVSQVQKDGAAFDKACPG